MSSLKTLGFFFLIFISTQGFATDFYSVTRPLNVRSGPGTNHEVIFLLNANEEVELISKNQNWYKINYNGKIGYVSSKYLEFSRSDSPINYNRSKLNGGNIILITTIIVFIIMIFKMVTSKSDQLPPQINEQNEILNRPINQNQVTNQPRAILIKSTKSTGKAIFLVLIFGPLGLFYSTLGGAIIMTLLAPIFLLYLTFTANWGSLILLIILFYPICLIWAIIGVNNYNNKILRDPNSY